MPAFLLLFLNAQTLRSSDILQVKNPWSPFPTPFSSPPTYTSRLSLLLLTVITISLRLWLTHNCSLYMASKPLFWDPPSSLRLMYSSVTSVSKTSSEWRPLTHLCCPLPNALPSLHLPLLSSPAINFMVYPNFCSLEHILGALVSLSFH